MSPRIPQSLQQIFITSQQGRDVKHINAPTGGIGFKLFNVKGKGMASTKPKPNFFKAPNPSDLNLQRGDSASVASQKAMKAKRKSNSNNQSNDKSPQTFLDEAIRERGYSTKKFNSLESAYYCRPTALQQASFGIRMSRAVRTSDAALLRRLVDAGLSPNPCNNWGESLIHMICRRGDHKLLRVMLDKGCLVQVTDDYGRTPLHDAFWRAEPSFETVQLLLDCDKNLIRMLDCRGSSPLSYIAKENYEAWINFLESRLDRFWPTRDVATEGEERPPSLTMTAAHSFPIPDPPESLPLEIAALVANGQMEPEETLDDEDSSFSDESYYSDSDDDEEGYESSESEFDMEEMTEICFRAGGPLAIAKKCFGNAGSSFPGARKMV